MSTRQAIEASWRAAQRRVNVVGVLPANAASYAGQLLEQANGDARMARDGVPTSTGEAAKFYATVRGYLAAVVTEESAERLTGS